MTASVEDQWVEVLGIWALNPDKETLQQLELFNNKLAYLGGSELPVPKDTRAAYQVPQRRGKKGCKHLRAWSKSPP